jgi:NTP pyrophosphatase (non-canonical NTP hydrolase)
MVKRILDTPPRDLLEMNAAELKESIQLAECRTIAAEIGTSSTPLVDGITNGELVAGLGADLVICNLYDVLSPVILGLPEALRDDLEGARVDQPLQKLRALIGRPIGINLEPMEDYTESQRGRIANRENALLALDQGCDILIVTGNPATGVTKETIARATEQIKSELGDQILLVAGKMHSAGIHGESGRELVDADDIRNYCSAGCDAVVVPCPAASAGFTVEDVRELVQVAHENEALAWLILDAALEGSYGDVVKQLGLYARMTGADVYEIGDAGFAVNAMAVPDNILTFSIAVRGRRHTFRRMALSHLR